MKQDSIRDGVAARVRAEAATRLLLQKDVAKIIGIPQPAMSLRWRGQRPFRAEELVVLACEWGIPLDSFMPDDAYLVNS